MHTVGSKTWLTLFIYFCQDLLIYPKIHQNVIYTYNDLNKSVLWWACYSFNWFCNIFCGHKVKMSVRSKCPDIIIKKSLINRMKTVSILAKILKILTYILRFFLYFYYGLVFFISPSTANIDKLSPVVSLVLTWSRFIWAHDFILHCIVTYLMKIYCGPFCLCLFLWRYIGSYGALSISHQSGLYTTQDGKSFILLLLKK